MRKRRSQRRARLLRSRASGRRLRGSAAEVGLFEWGKRWLSPKARPCGPSLLELRRPKARPLGGLRSSLMRGLRRDRQRLKLRLEERLVDLALVDRHALLQADPDDLLALDP